MNRATFQILCNKLRPHIERKSTKFRRTVPLEARVAITLWRLGTNAEYRAIAELFGVGRSTACEIVLETYEAITLHLLAKYVHFPQWRKPPGYHSWI